MFSKHIYPTSKTSQRYLHHGDKIIWKKFLSREHWNILCGVVELEIDFRKCGPFPYLVIRNILYTPVKNTQSHIF